MNLKRPVSESDRNTVLIALANAIAAATPIALAGGPWWAAILAGIGALLGTLGGGQMLRDREANRRRRELHEPQEPREHPERDTSEIRRRRNR
jgi:uncharacterized membrane protein